MYKAANRFQQKNASSDHPIPGWGGSRNDFSMPMQKEPTMDEQLKALGSAEGIEEQRALEQAHKDNPPPQEIPDEGGKWVFIGKLRKGIQIYKWVASGGCGAASRPSRPRGKR